MNIGIIGNGFVGKATNILKNDNVNIYIYDIDPKLCVPHGLTIKELCNTCDIIFISVPTPMNQDGSYYLNILESVVSDIESFVDLNKSLIVIRSTVTPGTSQRLNCYFMPEFLTEKNFVNDFKNNENWIFGCKNTDQDIHFRETIIKLFNYAYNENKIAYNNISFVTNDEAEMIKLFRNNFLSTKIAFCNEISEYCKIKNINYENVRALATCDKRIGESHTYVPGHDGQYGYGGTCFPKDTNGFLHDMKKSNMKSYIVSATVSRNEEVDRPNKDWNDNKGRAVI